MNYANLSEPIGTDILLLATPTLGLVASISLGWLTRGHYLTPGLDILASATLTSIPYTNLDSELITGSFRLYPLLILSTLLIL